MPPNETKENALYASASDVEPGDVLRSVHGRVVRRVICVDEGDVVVRMPAGGVDAIPLGSVERNWVKVDPSEFRRVTRAMAQRGEARQESACGGWGRKG